MDIDNFIELVDVENNFCFLPRGGLTFCNCYAKVVLASQDVFIPNALANDLADWLDKNKSNWTKSINKPSSFGPSAVCVAVAKRQPHGHIAVMTKNGLWTWAGAHNRKKGSLARAFGSTGDVVFYWRNP